MHNMSKRVFALALFLLFQGVQHLEEAMVTSLHWVITIHRQSKVSDKVMEYFVSCCFPEFIPC